MEIGLRDPSLTEQDFAKGSVLARFSLHVQRLEQARRVDQVLADQHPADPQGDVAARHAYEQAVLEKEAGLIAAGLDHQSASTLALAHDRDQVGHAEVTKLANRRHALSPPNLVWQRRSVRAAVLTTVERNTSVRYREIVLFMKASSLAGLRVEGGGNETDHRVASHGNATSVSQHGGSRA